MVRLNGSHESLDWHRQTIQFIRKVIPTMPILLDIPGRKLRLAIDTTVSVQTNDILDLPIPHWISEGTRVVFDDGRLEGIIYKKGRVKFKNDGQLRPRIGMNIPGVSIQGPLLTARDLEIIELAQTASVDFLGLSFIDSSELIHTVRPLCDRPCAAKIETRLAMQNLGSICQHADMVVVARGDLAVECSLFDVIKNQKLILQTAKKHNKVGAVGTGLLGLYPPQQSTIADIHNAVLDGANFLILSNDIPDGYDAIRNIRIFKGIIDNIIF